jgi:long-chain fatty acid transport protein
MGVDYAANLYGSKLLTSYIQLRVAPALAYQVMDRVSVGLAVNLAWAQMKYDAASALGNPVHDTSSSLGYGATVGLKIALPRDVALGVSYETKTTFQPFAFDVGAPEQDKLRFDQPGVLAGGLAWRPTSPLVLALDVEWINWSATNGKNQPRYVSGPSAAPGNPLAFDLDWSDQVVFKVGAEWAVSPAWRLRAGYDFGKSPLDKSRAFESIAFPAIAEHHLSAGFGWSATQALALNVAATWSPKATQNGANLNQGISGYTTSMSQLAFDVGLGWKY